MKIDVAFVATMQKEDTKSAWTFVIWPESSAFFGTKGLVKVRGKIDGKPFRASFMAMGNGKQMLPIKAETRKLIGKEAGNKVQIVLEERIES